MARYTQEFRKKAVEGFNNAEKKTEYCNELGISFNTIGRWKKQLSLDDFKEQIEKEDVIVSSGVGVKGVVGFKATHQFNYEDGKLNDKVKEDFCLYYVFDTPIFNHLHAYLKANKVDALDIEPTQFEFYEQHAKNMLEEPAVSIRINKLYSQHLLMTPQLADAQLAMLILQNEDKSVKLKAIQLYNELSDRLKANGVDKLNSGINDSHSGIRKLLQRN